ncbi:MAG: long-chain fatty acid--CoA ligase [Myxococcales bacterium]|nr:long-chain fatty acid--CoA ligase [Myxococcales bacterium]
MMTTSQDARRQMPRGISTDLTLDSARNLVELLLIRARTPTWLAARHKQNGKWIDVSWGEELQRVRQIGAGFKALGIEPGDRVAIFAETRYEWVLVNFGLYAIGAVAVPIYTSYTPADIAYILKDSGARAIVIDHDTPDAKQKQLGRLGRVRQIRAEVPTLDHVVLIDAPIEMPDALSFSELERRGIQKLQEPGEASLLEQAAARTSPDDLAYLLYTSGTTGKPKGVMLTHANWTSQARCVATNGLISDGEIALLFLPLAHAFALIVPAAHLGSGITIAYAESIETAINNAGETRSTLMTLVPRVLEKAFNKVVGDGAAQPGIKGQMFRWGMSQFEEYAAARVAGRDYSSVQWTLAKKLVFSQVEAKIQARFGGTMQKFVSGGAPLSKKIALFFDLCGFHMCEGYGLTETCAPTHVNLPSPDKKQIGTVGLPWKGVQVRIADDGELLLKGPQVMKGYFNQPEETAAAIDPEGWFHTGDIGRVDARGFLTITDRKKDLLKTSGGKYIAPQELENGLKTEPLIGNVLIIGDRRKFVSALITLTEEALLEFANAQSLPSRDFAELSRRPEVHKKIEAAVKALNARLPSYATVKRFAILDHEWTQKDGSITPTLKVKRSVVLERYRELIDGLYDGERFD